ncbi:IS3 family transposase [Streptomyces sp. MA15]|uniref:IS3 family transposase n=1 Tax=Streptomyces sp. MA15 TaxID=3055061 RepID=UPI0025B0C379|nr:IS3 family transposase [Streptomyces sp. MA15]MDN3272488.1 IS3 family transposase [Streptomyces sp. MA15]
MALPYLREKLTRRSCTAPLTTTPSIGRQTPRHQDFHNRPYAWREGEAARQARRAADDALAHEITVLHIASRRTYGVPRIHAELRRLGHRVNRKRIARVMRERDIRGVTRRKHRSLTRPDVKARPAPDLIGRKFHAERPGIKLVGDITYLPTAEGWLYLACWLDLRAVP